MSNRLIKLPEVSLTSSLPKSSIYRLMAENRFPKPLKLSARSVAWREADILEWIESRQAAA